MSIEWILCKFEFVIDLKNVNLEASHTEILHDASCLAYTDADIKNRPLDVNLKCEISSECSPVKNDWRLGSSKKEITILLPTV